MKDKVAIVTASSTGIGKAIIKRLGEERCKVVISSRNQEHVDKAVKEMIDAGIEAFGLVCHVGKQEDRQNLIKATIQRYGRIDYLVLNAAISVHMGTSLEINEKQLRKLWEINYLSTFFLVQECAPYLRKQPNSSIVIISSYTAYEPPNFIGHYGVTKTALAALTKLLAKDFMDDGIRVNGVAPGLIRTNFSEVLWKNSEQETIAQLGINRLGRPD